MISDNFYSDMSLEKDSMSLLFLCNRWLQIRPFGVAHDY